MNTIIHIIGDDVFYKGTARVFNAIPNIKNIYLAFVPENYTFKYIDDVSDLTIVNSKKDLYSYMERKEVVAVYFHSLSSARYHIILHIPRRIKIIWWAWGYDTYCSYLPLNPLIDIDLYKPLTKKYYKEICNDAKRPRIKKIVSTLLRPVYFFYRMKTIKRVDYCKTVLPIEFEYLKKNHFFKADYFDFKEFSPFDCVHHSSTENLIIGNSATITNNHLDIIEKLTQSMADSFKKIVFPVNYGDRKYATYLRSRISFNNVVFLDEFLSYEKYSLLYSSFTHAIFGHIRQQAIGNVMMALRNSCKVFLYKDSVIYKQFKEKWGFIIYTIEEDLNEANLQTTLTENEEIFNYNRYIQVFGNKPSLEEELNRILQKK